MHRLVLVVSCAAACAPVDPDTHDPAEAAIVVASGSAVEPVPVGVPHGGTIQVVAATEQGDAAVSLDHLGALRLWPVLDGSREPVAFSVTGALDVAISHAGADLLVAVLDQAGAVQLLRFSRAGAARGRTQIPGDVAVDQLVAIDGGVLVARADESIERYDATGVPRGRLTAEPGASFGALATRHGAAAVILAERRLEPPIAAEKSPRRRHRRPAPMITHGHAAAMRWIALADQRLRWGATVALPDDLDERELAISPSHERVALISRANELVVLDTTLAPIRVEGPKTSVATGTPIGFVDDDRAVQLSGTAHWWISDRATKTMKAADPWQVDHATSDESIDGDGAVADGIVVAGSGPALVLQDVRARRYLGWRQLANGLLISGGSLVGIKTTSSVVWLDRALQRESELDLEDHQLSTRDQVWSLDPDHAVVVAATGRQSPSLVDFRHPDPPIGLGNFDSVQDVDYAGALHQLVVVDGARVAHRFTVDLEHDRVIELPALDLPFTPLRMIQLDPARSGGVVALAYGYEDSARIATFKEDPAHPHKRLRAKARELTASYLGYADDGTIFLRDGKGVYAMRGDKTVGRFPPGEVVSSIVADPSGSWLVGIHDAGVAMYDRAGTVRWRQPVWGAQSSVFTPDGAAIVVQTTGGLVALDPATGARVAMACGFAFGLMTKKPPVSPFNTRPVCEDPGT